MERHLTFFYEQVTSSERHQSAPWRQCLSSDLRLALKRQAAWPAASYLRKVYKRHKSDGSKNGQKLTSVWDRSHRRRCLRRSMTHGHCTRSVRSVLRAACLLTARSAIRNCKSRKTKSRRTLRNASSSVRPTSLQPWSSIAAEMRTQRINSGETTGTTLAVDEPAQTTSEVSTMKKPPIWPT